MSETTEDKLKDQEQIPLKVLQEVIFQKKYEQRSNLWISDHLKKMGHNYSKDKIDEIIKKWNKTPKKLQKQYYMDYYAHQRREQKSERKRFGIKDETLALPSTFSYEKTDKKKTSLDIIRVFLEKGCFYCRLAKETGAYQRQMDKIKKKYRKKFHIFEITVLANSIFSVTDKGLRIDLQHEITNMGLIPPFMDLYFPMIYIQSPTHEIIPQFRRGIDTDHLEDAINHVIENKPYPEPWYFLPSDIHTGTYIEKLSLGVNISRASRRYM